MAPPSAPAGQGPTPSDMCFLASFQGFTITRELQPNGLHPIENHSSHFPRDHVDMIRRTSFAACRIAVSPVGSADDTVRSAAAVRCLSAGRPAVLPRALRGFDAAGRTDLFRSTTRSGFRKDVKSLRGVIVHQHGCGEGSCKSGLTGAYDLHWQALAKKHDCALLAPSYEQPEKADCQMWCDPRMARVPRFRSASSISARSRDIPSWRRCRGRCGDTAAAVTGPAAWCCCIRNVSPPRGCAPACRC